MSRVSAAATGLASWLLCVLTNAEEGAADRAAGFVAAHPETANAAGSSGTGELLVATSLAVVVAVLLLLLSGAWSRRSAAALDRLEAELEDTDA